MERDCIKIAPNIIIHVGPDYLEIGDGIQTWGLGTPAVIRTADQARQVIKQLEDAILHGVIS